MSIRRSFYVLPVALALFVSGLVMSKGAEAQVVTVYSPPVVAPVVTAPVQTGIPVVPPVVVERPAIPVAPTVQVGRPVTTSDSVVVARPSWNPAPVVAPAVPVVAPPVYVAPRPYVPGQPVRNFFRAMGP